MNISEQAIKLLWGRAASRCAICKSQLTQDKQYVSAAFPVGEQAHIVGEKLGAARGRSILTEQERNSYHNLILLCPTCHTIIDKNVEDYPVEKLHILKSAHELWVQQSLVDSLSSIQSLRLVEDMVYATLIDAAVTGCCLDSWESWVSRIISTEPSMATEIPHLVNEFERAVFKAIWPGRLPELECALKNLAFVISEAIALFLQHTRFSDGKYEVYRFYKDEIYPQAEYHQRLQEYEQWVKQCDAKFIEATKAVNWFAQLVRRDVNPAFFATNGKFTIIYGDMYHGYSTLLPEYEDEEKRHLLQNH